MGRKVTESALYGSRPRLTVDLEVYNNSRLGVVPRCPTTVSDACMLCTNSEHTSALSSLDVDVRFLKSDEWI